MVEGGIIPEGWRGDGRCVAQEAVVVGIGYLESGQLEFVYPHAMDRLFVVLSGFAAHEEPAGGDADSWWSVELTSEFFSPGFVGGICGGGGGLAGVSHSG